MSNELPTTDSETKDGQKEMSPYQEYLGLGGIINEKDYNSALSKLELTDEDGEIPDKHRIKQAVKMAELAGIGLNGQPGDDKRVKLYSILRNDARPANQKYHHSNMDDPHIFVEALRMLDDVDSVEKMIIAYPGTSFEYKWDSGDK